MTGTGRLLLLYLRRDRVVAPGWVLFLVLLVVGMVPYYGKVFPTEAARLDFVAEVGGNSALTAFTGPLHGHGLGNLALWKIGDIGFTLTALMAILSVVRHTRAEEESGRAELVGAAVIGRFASLTASLLLACAVSLLTGLLTGLGMIGNGLDAPGSLTMALAMAMPGVVFAAVAAVAAQLTVRSRSANAIAFTVLGVAYLFRFVADGGDLPWLRWMSPLGWSHLMEPFAADRWWVAVVPLLLAAALVVVAYRLAARRDLGAGTLPERLGAHAAAPSLRSPLALAWRQHKGQLFGWSAAYAVFCMATAGIAKGMPEVAKQGGAQVEEFFRRYTASPDAGLSDTFIWMVLVSLAGLATLYPMLATLRLRAEESSGRAELTLSASVTRTSWAVSHLVFAAAGGASVMAAGGLGAGLVYGLSMGDVGTQLPRVLGAALALVPAVWTVGAIGMLAFGLVPRPAVAVIWVVFLGQQVFGEAVGPALGIDYWVANTIVPMHHVPKILTGASFSATPLIVLTLLTLALAGLGLAAFKRRDLA
ncbi:polyketide antibiotic transporter [Nonomuraea jabiensis]|uniref:ABC transporter permease n=1 Tax=Nonomuraea jabiensis TaxID=882448 RepID=UPI0034449740